MERVDRDGARHYVAVEADPMARERRAFSLREAQVLRLLARGVQAKVVSYALGIGAPGVSRALHSATVKIGLRSPIALIQLMGRLSASSSPAVHSATLTPAEKEIVEHLRQGHTNAQIAKQRSTSERTVANQVAAVLHKLQLPSRRAVAALVDTAILR